MSSHSRLNARQIAEELGCGLWIVRGVKKANRLFAEQGKEDLIFTGFYSTPAKVGKWLDDHPQFVAAKVLDPTRGLAKPGPREPRSRQPLQAAGKSRELTS